MRQPWDRIPTKGKQAGETDSNYRYFTLFLEMGPGRTVQRFSESAPASHPVHENWPSCDYFRQLSAKFKWISRAGAYDIEIDRLAREARQRRIRELMLKRMDYELDMHEEMIRYQKLLVDRFEKASKAPSVNIEEQTQKLDGEITIKKVSGLRGTDLANLSKEVREATAAIINGLRPKPDKNEKKKAPTAGSSGTFTYVKPKQNLPRARKTDKPDGV